MPILNVYPHRSELPDSLYYQAQAFSRIFWYDSDDYDIDLEYEDMKHIVIANGKSLISYAQLLWRNIEFSNTKFKCYGLGGVMTFPHYRNRGFGSQIVQAAISLIYEDEAADIALLWTESNNQHFYEKLGWEMMPNLTTLVGDKAKPEIVEKEFAMMLFISDVAQKNRPNFENGRLYIGEEAW